MEKMIVLLPIILFMGFFGFLIFGFLFIVFRIIIKSKNSSWTGTVIDKKHNEVRDSEDSHKMNHFYYLVVKTNEGKEMKVGLSYQLWEAFAVGEKITKPKGKLFPEKVL
jgi:hypothetical protein